tara:strand:+ start:132 stop:452 length:321 start_codon:yes stop_codon:yes gene_type:complete
MKVIVHPISEVRIIRFNVEGPTSEQFCTSEMVMQYLCDDMTADHYSVHKLVRSTYKDVDLIEESVEVLAVRVVTATYEQYLEQQTRYWFEATVTAKIQVYDIGGSK